MMSESVSKMKKVNETGVVPTPEEISELEAFIGYKLPKVYLDFICNPNAAFTYKGGFDVMGGVQSDRLDNFMPLSKISGAKVLIEDEEIPPYVIPFAQSPWGNFICIAVDETKPDYGWIYYRDYERGSGVDDSDVAKICESLPEFLSMLKPFEEPVAAKGNTGSGQ